MSHFLSALVSSIRPFLRGYRIMLYDKKVINLQQPGRLEPEFKKIKFNFYLIPQKYHPFYLHYQETNLKIKVIL
jgi:hypothetical protein